MISIADIVDTLANDFPSWRTLSDVRPHLRDGRPIYVTGNAAVTFFVRHKGREKILKCYTRDNPHLATIYGDAFRPRELRVFNMMNRSDFVDCLLTDRIEGITLDRAVCTATSDGLAALADAFDRMAVGLLDREYAHGDLKPENIIVTPDGDMRAIDWDAAFTPELAGNAAPETGTAAYQHPLRTNELFDKHIDDYSIAMLSTMLHAAAVDPATAEHYRLHHEFAINPRDIARGELDELDRVTEIFAARGMAVQYRLARMLLSPIPQLFDLKRVMSFSVRDDKTASDMAVAEELNGLWGCRSASGWSVPPLYDAAFDPSDGIILASLGGYSHFLSLDGRTLRSFGRGDVVKPFRKGCAAVRRKDGACLTITVDSLGIKVPV